MENIDQLHNVLAITSYYPPGKQVGAERVLKFKKYLPSYGYKYKVLTLSDYGQLAPEEEDVFRAPSIAGSFYNLISKGRLKSLSESNYFQEKIPSHEKSRLWPKFRSLIINNLFIPDVMITWLPAAFILGIRIIKKSDIKLIMATSPSPSALLIGALLSVSSRIPLVLDFRDGWVFENPDPNYFSNNLHLRRRVESFLEKWVLSKADAVVAVSDPLTEYFVRKYKLSKECAVTIPNGFDPEDWENARTPDKDPNKFRIVYTGRIISRHRALCLERFIEGLSLTERSIIDRTEVLLLGVPSSESKLIQKYRMEKTVKIIPYLPKQDSIGYQISSDLLLLLIGKDKSVVTSKVFEYLYSNRPIWVLGDADCAGSKLVNRIHAGVVTDSDQPHLISKTLRKTFSLWEQKKLYQKASLEITGRYNRKMTAKQLSHLFNAILDGS